MLKFNPKRSSSGRTSRKRKKFKPKRFKVKQAKLLQVSIVNGINKSKQSKIKRQLSQLKGKTTLFKRSDLGKRKHTPITNPSSQPSANGRTAKVVCVGASSSTTTNGAKKQIG